MAAFHVVGDGGAGHPVSARRVMDDGNGPHPGQDFGGVRRPGFERLDLVDVTAVAGEEVAAVGEFRVAVGAFAVSRQVAAEVLGDGSVG